MPTTLEKVVFAALRAPSYMLEVVGADDVTAHLRRVRFAAPDLLQAHEIAPAFWIRLWFPSHGDEYQRAYTVTAVSDAGEFDIDFVLHDIDGLASAWARDASAGDHLRATVLGAKRFVVPDPPPPGYLLVGDAASLPAINEILAALPANVPARVVLETVHDNELSVAVRLRDGDDLTRVDRRPDGSALPEAVAKLTGEIAGYLAWVATETKATRDVRAVLTSDAGLPRSAVTAQGYWHDGRPMGHSPHGNDGKRR